MSVVPFLNHHVLLVKGCFFFFFFFFLGLHLQHMEVPKQGVKLELQLPAYTTATALTATQGPRSICDLSCSLQQCRIPHPLIRLGIETASTWTLCQVLNPWSHKGNS